MQTRFIQRSADNDADIEFTGQRARLLSGETPVTGWITGGVIRDVPSGVYKLETMSDEVVSVQDIAIGAIVATAGQSNISQWFGDFNNNPQAGTYQFGTKGWGSITGAAAQEFASAFSKATGIPVALIDLALPGTSLLAANAFGRPYWADTSAGSLYSQSSVRVSQAGGDLEMVLWSQGETDRLNLTGYDTALADVLTRMHQDWGNPTILIQEAYNIPNLKAAQEAVVARLDFVSIGAVTSALNAADTVHLERADMVEAAHRLAASAAGLNGSTVAPSLYRQGTDGDDSISGSALRNVVSGGLGDDTIAGASRNDVLSGGFGDDVLRGHAGNDLLTGGVGNDILYGGTGDDYLDGLFGDDILIGGDGNDTLIAYLGGDRLEGGAGNDNLIGSRDANVLIGGSGADRLAGGGGADRFVFTEHFTAADLARNRDNVMDFSHLEGDRLDLSGVFAGTLTWRGFGTMFSGQAGEVWVQQFGNHNVVHIDLNGDRKDDLQIMVIDGGIVGPDDFIL